MLNELDKVAEAMFDAACLAQSKRMNPNKKEHSPRDVSCEFSKLYDEPKAFYRALAQWHLENK